MNEAAGIQCAQVPAGECRRYSHSRCDGRYRLAWFTNDSLQQAQPCSVRQGATGPTKCRAEHSGCRLRHPRTVQGPGVRCQHRRYTNPLRCRAPGTRRITVKKNCRCCGAFSIYTPYNPLHSQCPILLCEATPPARAPNKECPVSRAEIPSLHGPWLSSTRTGPAPSGRGSADRSRFHAGFIPYRGWLIASSASTLSVPRLCASAETLTLVHEIPRLPARSLAPRARAGGRSE